jgi:hypothetical protein
LPRCPFRKFDANHYNVVHNKVERGAVRIDGAQRPPLEFKGRAQELPDMELVIFPDLEHQEARLLRKAGCRRGD